MLAHAYNIIIDCGVLETGNGREVVDVLNATGKILLLMLMTTLQLPGAADYYSQMASHNSTANPYIRLAREFQKQLSDRTQEHGLLDHGKDRRRASKQKWTERKYHVQDRKYVSNTLVKIFLRNNSVPSIVILRSARKTSWRERVN